jgi:CRP-like cAMP-binding protein
MQIRTSETALEHWRSANALLERLAAHEWAELMPFCERVELRSGEVLYEPGDLLTHVYFPLSCMISLVAVMHDGRAVETMTIGREGVAATSASGYVDPAFTRFLVQVPGFAVRVAARDFEGMLDASVGLCSAVSRYREVLFRTTLQLVACNAIHTVRQRCARWILTTHDRSGSDQLPLTQSTLAEMLGVKRNAVNITIRELVRLGLIENRRGLIRVLNRADLNFVACECYGLVYGEQARLLTDGLSPECFD